ncbi:MAG: hypothetical protein U0176_26935 [Bacteroidia bacterium]
MDQRLLYSVVLLVKHEPIAYSRSMRWRTPMAPDAKQISDRATSGRLAKLETNALTQTWATPPSPGALYILGWHFPVSISRLRGCRSMSSEPDTYFSWYDVDVEVQLQRLITVRNCFLLTTTGSHPPRPLRMEYSSWDERCKH